jgi:hypothetical protein
LSDVRRQPIAYLVHLRRDGGATIVIAAVKIDRPDLDHQAFE